MQSRGSDPARQGAGGRGQGDPGREKGPAEGALGSPAEPVKRKELINRRTPVHCSCHGSGPVGDNE